MKRIIATTAAIALGCSLMAQDSKVTTGVVAYNEGRYDECIAKIEEGLPAATVKTQPKGYYHLAMSYLLRCQDTMFLDKDPEKLVRAEECWRKTKEVDVKQQFTKPAAAQLTEMQRIVPVMRNAAAHMYQKATAAKRNKNTADAKKYFGYAAKFFGLEAQYNKADITPGLYAGYAQLEMQDTAAATTSIAQAVESYKATTKSVAPVAPDATVAGACLTLAQLQLSRRDTVGSLASITYGREVCQQGDRTKLKPEQVSEIDQTDKDLQRTELGVYQQNRKYYQVAKQKFEAAVKSNPKDFDIRAAYGALVLENESESQGLDIFRELLKEDPSNFQGNYQLGRYYINAAAVLNEQQQKETNDEKLELLQKQVKENLNKGLPFIKKLHQLQPDNAEWLTQLVNITPYMDGYDEKELMDYMTKLKALNSKAGGK